MAYLIYAVAILLAYLFGSIPVGVIVARLYGVNVLATGSGRTGGTNVLRAAGPLAAGLTVLGDVMKALIPLFFMKIALPPLVVALAMPAVVLGHNHSIFLGFRGGAGAGPAIGAVGGISFPVGVLVAVCGLVALVTTRYASLLTTTIAASSVLLLAGSAALGYTAYEYVLGAVLILLVIVYALRQNYARIRQGTERKVGQPKPDEPAITGTGSKI